MKKHLRFTLLFLLILPAFFSLSQVISIRGRVIDATTLEPLPFTNVFMDNTTIGTTTDTEGNFTLRNLRGPNNYELIVSFVGYELYKQKITINDSDITLPTIRLIQSEIQLSEVSVTAKKDKQWEDDLKKFEKIFLGKDAYAKDCIIKNPWAIDFETNKEGKIIAKASAPIRIENFALGYTVNFYLSRFIGSNKEYLIEGKTQFIEMETEDEKEFIKWQENRKTSYMFSRQHLFKAMIDRKIRGEGFELFTEMPGFQKVPRSSLFYSDLGTKVQFYDTSQLVTNSSQIGIYALNIRGRLEVHYREARGQIKFYNDVAFPVSWIEVSKGPILVNQNGYELNPEQIIVSGEMNIDRVAHLLPRNYLPVDLSKPIKEEISLSEFYEKLYVHTDKPYYYPGEKCWFKGYVNYSHPIYRDSLSKTAYVELIDSNKKIIDSKILEIDSGLFFANFNIQDSLAAGNYYLRAYTNLNRNFGENILFIKPISIFNITEKVDPKQGVYNSSSDNRISIEADKELYSTREKITLTIQTKDDAGFPVASNLSVSVTDANQVVPLITGNNILTQYSIDKSPKLNGAEIKFPLEHGISFSARFYNKEDKPEKAVLNIIQLKPDNFYMGQSDENGEFSIDGLVFYDSTKFIIQSIDKKGNLYGRAELIKRSLPFFFYEDVTKEIKTIKTEFPQRVATNFEIDKKAIMLKEVEIKASKIRDEYSTEYRIKRSYGKPDYVVQGSDLTKSYGSLLLALQGRFPGLIIRQANNTGDNGGTRWVVYTNRSAGGSVNYPKEVLVMINDTPASGNAGDILGTINPDDVETVELKTGINVLYPGSMSGAGILSIYTKKGVAEKRENKKNLNYITVKGYQQPETFKAPDYESKNIDPSFVDYRSLLYWNPYVTTTEETGKVSFSFFAGDLSTSYSVVVEGIDQNNEPIRSVYFIGIKK